MNKCITSIIVLSACVAAYGWERVNTNTIYFIDDSATIKESVAPSKNISINGQDNFKSGEAAKWKVAPPTNVIVENGVNIISEVLNRNTNTYVGGWIQIGKTNITLKGNNVVSGDQLWFSDDGASFCAENATIKLSGTNGFRVDSNSSVVLKGGSVEANQFRIYSKKGSITLDGATANVGKIYSGGSMGGMTTAEDFSLILKNNTSLTLSDSSYTNPKYSANSAFHGKIFVDGGSQIKSTYSKYCLYTPAEISVSGESSSIALSTITSKSVISIENGAKITADTVAASDVFVGSNSTLNSTSTLTVENTISVASDANISSSKISFEKLTIAFGEDFSADSDVSFNLGSIFGGNASVVIAALESGSEFTVKGNNGEFSASYKDIDGGTIHIGTQVVPEPATIAAILGAVALSFAVFRRRK